MASQSLHKKPMASALNQAAPEELLIFVIQRSDWVEIFKFSVFILLMIMVCKNRLL